MDRDQIIRDYMPQVDKWVRGFVHKRPAHGPDFDDLLGVAHLRLVEIADEFLEGKIDTFSVYLRLSICTAISDYIRSNTVVPCRGKDPPVVEFYPCRAFIDHRTGGDVDPFPRILQCAKDGIDKAIILFKAEGQKKTWRDVAAETGLSRSTIHRRLKAIKARYDKLP